MLSSVDSVMQCRCTSQTLQTPCAPWQSTCTHELSSKLILNARFRREKIFSVIRLNFPWFNMFLQVLYIQKGITSFKISLQIRKFHYKITFFFHHVACRYQVKCLIFKKLKFKYPYQNIHIHFPLSQMSNPKIQHD